MNGPTVLTRRQVIALAAAGAALAGCASAPPVAISTPNGATTTPAEQAVRAALERYWAVSQGDDAEAILAYVADDAKVDSILAGGKVPKAEYATALRAWLKNPERREIKSENRIERVTFASPSLARVDTQAMLRRDPSFSRSGWGRDRRIEYTLAERGGRWLIVETTYTQK
jgi:hypothetical protein